MRRIRVLLGDLPADIEDRLQTTISLERDIEIVGQATGTFQVLARIGDALADIVLIALPESGMEPGIVSHILGEYPFLGIIAISPQMDRIVLFRCTITRRNVAGAVPETLGSVIREAAAALDV